MRVVIVGSGKLASELLEHLDVPDGMDLCAWGDLKPDAQARFVVHAGSGRELPQVIDYCERTRATLLELSTGSILEGSQTRFAAVLCPNTNILMLKFMCMVATSAKLFSGNVITLEESHQSSKTSVPGTAVAIAKSLGISSDAIVSERDPDRQLRLFEVGTEDLERHAVHRIFIRAGGTTVRLESRALGATPYASGVGKLLRVLCRHELERRLYRVEEFVMAGWL